MDSKTKISANGTYVLDPEDIEQLDELSLTSLINAIPQPQPSPKAPDAGAADTGDTTINEMLRGAPATTDRPPADAPESQEQSESTGDLVDPALIFTDPPPPRR
jgi:hypothetical protein